ncbi:hypothetical protein V6N13_045126 [Hibiscus sabdariffa]
MENNCGMMGLREDEIELDLGLSIGGSFGKAEKLKPIKNEPKPSNNSVADLGESVVFDPQTKREVQALRRQEARKKREHKQQRRGISHRNGEFQSKDNGAGAMEERECKKTRIQEFSGNVNPNLSGELNNPLVCPVIPVRVPGPYPQLQFVPLANGFAYSCVNAVPYWGDVAGNEKRVVQPVAVAVNGVFPSFQTAQESGVNGYYSEHNSSRDERKRKTASNESTIYSSSTGSDLQSSSNQGGCSSETGAPAPQINCSAASNLKGQSEQSATSHPTDSAQSIDKSRKGIEKTHPLNAAVSTSSNPKEEPKPQTESDVDSKPVSTNEAATTAFSKDTKGKPPKPRTPPPTNDNVMSLRNMPCVSTTGNGPNGKTINGFLYRYTNSEVSIVCVCHGSSFTPAEFVQHAGGTDVSHPLRHITMVPTDQEKVLSSLSLLFSLRSESKSSGNNSSMASTQQEVPAGVTAPAPDVVGNAFVHQYYLILHQSPELVHRFYHDTSKLGRPEENGIMSITTTMQAINEKILALGFEEFTAEITSVDAQDSHNGGVLVLVTGYLTGKDKLKRKFTQTFFLAPQDKGYFVLNDMFRYIDDGKYESGSQDPVNNIETSLAPEQDYSPALENHIEQLELFSEEANGLVYNPSEDGDGSNEEEEAPVAEVVDEVVDDLEMVTDSNSKIEEVPKKSYASILKVMKENATPVSISAHSTLKPLAKSHEQPKSAAPPAAPAMASDAQVSSNNFVENGNNQDVQAEGPSIYIKGLPLNVTPSMLENEFKKFGPIKNGGIQVRSQKGFCFGFVEFEMASSVQSAIEASPINIGGRNAVVEEKRSTSRGNRGRSSSGSGFGYRNEGARGRGNYSSGRGYGRGEFGNRSNNRGGYFNRGGDGYQRGEHMGSSNGGRVNRSGGLAKNVAPTVSAPA